MEILKLRKFDIDKCKCKNILILGKRETGKSFLTKDFLYHKSKDIHCGGCFTNTNTDRKFYSQFIPNSSILNFQYDTSAIIIDKLITYSNNTNKNYFMSFDDVFYEHSVSHLSFFEKILKQNNILTILTMPYPLGLSPTIKKLFNYVFIFRENYFGNKKRLYEHYGQMFSSFDKFCEVLDQYTQDYDCLVIYNTPDPNVKLDITELVFWYKAESHNEFKLFDNDDVFSDGTEAEDEAKVIAEK